MFEKLPVPFGLVRYGVAPDHPEVKNVINTFNQVAQHRNFRFFGNVTIGKDLSIKEMKELYSGIVLAYGAAVDKKLGIPGENLKQVYAATDIVGWYNGLPENENFTPDLSGDEAMIIGHGNVALDIARILLSHVDMLKSTDIPDKVLAQLASSKLKRIHLIGRRGPLQVAFTIKEFREMLKLDGVLYKIIDPEGVDLKSLIIENLPRPRRRLTSLIMDVMKKEESIAKENYRREWIMHFLRSPVEVLSSDSLNVNGIKFGINRLQGNDVISTNESLIMNCQIVIRSIGYRSTQIDRDIPFDLIHNLIPNNKGLVTEMSDQSESSATLYCVGWIKRGPVGVIIDTLSDAQETSDTILRDMARVNRASKTHEDVDCILQSKGIRSVSFSDWEAIDRLETNIGQLKGKPREKLTNMQNLLSAVTKEIDKK